MHTQDNGASACVLALDIHAPGFNGSVSMKWMDPMPAWAPDLSAESPDDQRYGEFTEIANPHVELYVIGARNIFGMLVTLKGDVMITNNAPNAGGGFGGALLGVSPTGEILTGDDPQTSDAFWMKIKPVRGPGEPCLQCFDFINIYAYLYQ